MTIDQAGKQKAEKDVAMESIFKLAFLAKNFDKKPVSARERAACFVGYRTAVSARDPSRGLQSMDVAAHPLFSPAHSHHTT